MSTLAEALTLIEAYEAKQEKAVKKTRKVLETLKSKVNYSGNSEDREDLVRLEAMYAKNPHHKAMS